MALVCGMPRSGPYSTILLNKAKYRALNFTGHAFRDAWALALKYSTR